MYDRVMSHLSVPLALAIEPLSLQLRVVHELSALLPRVASVLQLLPLRESRLRPVDTVKGIHYISLEWT